MRRLHYDWAHLLLNFVDVLCYPHLWTADLISKESFFAYVTKRLAKQLSFYQFGQILMQVAELTADKFVFGGIEPCSSRTCDICGTICINLGGKKYFFCNGARGGCCNNCGRDPQGMRSNGYSNAQRLQGHE